MLIRFKVKNFLSFNDLQEFDMLAGKVRSKNEHLLIDKNIKLRKFAAIYGANASGKTNLIKSIQYAQNILKEKNFNVNGGKYCKTNKKNKENPSYFEFEIKLKDKYYTYGFELLLKDSKLVSEWLYELLPNGEEKKIFEYDASSKVTDKLTFGKYFKSSKLIDLLNVYARPYNDIDIEANEIDSDLDSNLNVLFLCEMNNNKVFLYKEEKEAFVFRDVYNWLCKNIKIVYPNTKILDYSKWYFTKSNKDNICELLKSFGTGIESFHIEDVDINELNPSEKEIITQIIFRAKKTREKAKNVGFQGVLRGSDKMFIITFIKESDKYNINTIKFKHINNDDTLYGLDEESDGTIRLMDLIDILIDDNKEDVVYIIDELDRSLHPQLTYKFVEQFFKLTKGNNIQLITSTHESHIMNFDLLRRDEIWFVNKNNKGESNIYSLDEFNERFDRKIDKAYLEGRYKGIPIFDTYFPVKE
ncbi:ATP/GTP-binding protein [Anaerofustis butyriciformans]|uniref:AAA family ATPase n=1 Tax=Anaerofustis butyriciformans TaxID=3108533 RepID=UPI002E302B3C|nr:ATP/GTP-binding protein [Anaerofustis sp. HA2171]